MSERYLYNNTEAIATRRPWKHDFQFASSHSFHSCDIYHHHHIHTTPNPPPENHPIYLLNNLLNPLFLSTPATSSLTACLLSSRLFSIIS
jgi:hypothetical protein